MYMGEHSTTLDGKGRITVSRPIRDAMDVFGHHTWYMARGFDRCVFLFPQEAWKKLMDTLSGMGSMNTKALDFKRMLLGSAAQVRVDNQGRMSVPQHLRELAGLDADSQKEAVLLGVEDHLELWNKDKWRSFQDAKDAEYRDIAAQLFGGGMSSDIDTPAESAVS